MNKKYFLIVGILLLLLVGGYFGVQKKKNLINNRTNVSLNKEVQKKPVYIQEFKFNNDYINKNIDFNYPYFSYINKNGNLTINNLELKKSSTYILDEIGGRIGEFYVAKNGVFVNVLRKSESDFQVWSNYKNNLMEEIELNFEGELNVKILSDKILLLDNYNGRIKTYSIQKNNTSLMNNYMIEGDIIESSSENLYTINIKPKAKSYINQYNMIDGGLIEKQSIGKISFSEILISNKILTYSNNTLNFYLKGNLQKPIKQISLDFLTKNISGYNPIIKLYEVKETFFASILYVNDRNERGNSSLIKIDKKDFQYEIILENENVVFNVDDVNLYIIKPN